MFINLLNSTSVSDHPTKIHGWVVKETKRPGKQPGKFNYNYEFGTWLTEEVFLGVRIDGAIARKYLLGRIDPPIPEKNVYYYLLNSEAKFKLTTYTNSKDKQVPMLTGVDEEAGETPVLLTAISKSAPGKKILHVDVDPNSVVVRDYIDKDRNFIGLIVASNVSGTINPSTTIHMETGAINSTTMMSTKYSSDISALHTEEDMHLNGEPNATRFISLNRYVQAPNKIASRAQKPEGDNKGSAEKPVKKFNKNNNFNGSKDFKKDFNKKNNYKSFQKQPRKNFNKNQPR